LRALSGPGGGACCFPEWTRFDPNGLRVGEAPHFRTVTASRVRPSAAVGSGSPCDTDAEEQVRTGVEVRALATPRFCGREAVAWGLLRLWGERTHPALRTHEREPT